MSVNLDGNLTIDDLVAIARYGEEVELGEGVEDKVRRNRKTLENLVSSSEDPIYGVTTGFGDLVKEEIPPDELQQLQVNLLRSHSAGVGEPLPDEVVRGIIALRVNSLGMGYSGVRYRVVETLVELLNKGVVPYVPKKGSLGASGDLIPLAHVASVLIGEGKAAYRGELLSGEEALRRAGVERLELQEKEGLALINGTQAMASVISLALYDGDKLLRYADLVGGMSTFMVGGNFAQYDSAIYDLRPFRGQKDVAKNFRTLTGYDPEEYRPKNVQDPYSIRCIPQVHGSVRKALDHGKEIIRTEINSVTDNPLIFDETNRVISGGNFHGEPVALAADYVKLALSELGSISERRMNRLLHPDLNGDLPDFLAKEPGTDSGLMMAQYTSAALASENKNLSFPSSTDSIPVSGDQEDHVSMGMNGANNLRQVVDNVRNILAVELIGSCQAQEYKDLELTPPLEKLYDRVRQDIPAIGDDRELASLIDRATKLLSDDELLEEFTREFGIT